MRLIAFVLLGAFYSLNSSASDSLIEVGVGAGGEQVLRSGVATGAGAAAGAATLIDSPSWSPEVEVSLNALFANLYLRINPVFKGQSASASNPIYQAEMRGSVLGWFQLQDLLIRRNDVDLAVTKDQLNGYSLPGNITDVELGVGPNISVFDFATVGASLGLAYAQYQYLNQITVAQNGQVSTQTSLEDAWSAGAYVGAQVHVKFWRIKNDLYASYRYAAVAKQTQGASFGEKMGMNIENNLYLDAFHISLLEMGPELRLRLLEMPQGEEFTARLGLKVKASF